MRILTCSRSQTNSDQGQERGRVASGEKLLGRLAPQSGRLGVGDTFEDRVDEELVGGSGQEPILETSPWLLDSVLRNAAAMVEVVDAPAPEDEETSSSS